MISAEIKTVLVFALGTLTGAALTALGIIFAHGGA
jgi:hypothetical protein